MTKPEVARPGFPAGPRSGLTKKARPHETLGGPRGRTEAETRSGTQPPFLT